MPVANVLILFNPISGKSKGESIAKELKAKLESRKVHALCFNSRDIESIDCSSFDRLVVVGGDGTLRSLLSKILKCHIPVCLYPCGNQSLFARQFSYPKNINLFIELILNGHIEKHYVGEANHELFFFMVSVGFDGFIVNKINNSRTAGISNWNYFTELLRNVFLFRSPVLSVEVNGQDIATKQCGYVIVANSKHYALDVQVTPAASSLDPRFVVRFIPCKTALGFLWNLLISTERTRQSIFGDNIKIQVLDKNTNSCQVDGDILIGEILQLAISPERLLVLTPN